MKKVCPAFWGAQRVNGLSSGEGLIAKVADREEYDKETKQLETIPVEKRLYVVEEELSSVFAHKQREGNTLSQVIRSAFDNGDLNTLTVESRQAVGAHISITGHITPEELKQCLTGIDMVNGFGNRFMWFVAKSNKIMAKTNPIPDEVHDILIPHLRALKALGDSRKEICISRDNDAEKLWETVYPELRYDKAGLSGSMTSRRSTLVSRVALIYSLLDAPLIQSRLGNTVSYRIDSSKVQIKYQHLKAALAVWVAVQSLLDLAFSRVVRFRY